MRTMLNRVLTALAVIAVAALAGGTMWQVLAATTYTPPCTANTDTCRQARIVALEQAVGALQPSVTVTPTPSPSVTVTPTPTVSVTPTPTVSPSPVPVGFPDASTTGARGTPTVTRGATTLSTAGQVVTNTRFTGRVTITAPNVTLRNVTVATGDFWVILNNSRDLVVEDSTLIGGDGSEACIGGGPYTARRVDCSGSRDGFKMHDAGTLADSYIHDLSDASTAHNDGIEASGTPLRITHNTILNDHSQTSCIWVQGPSTDAIVENNLVAGGGYTVYGPAVDTPAASNVIVRNNTFSKRYYPRSGFWGPVAYWASGNGNTWTGNHYEDGSPVNP